MATITVKGNVLEYSIYEDIVLVTIDNKKICIPLDKVSRDPIEELKLSKKMLREYLEKSKLVKSSLKK